MTFPAERKKLLCRKKKKTITVTNLRSPVSSVNVINKSEKQMYKCNYKYS